tara:strand:+ start:215 stop:418 length:204 start_codon:yes stop_codon:yes gene_type:complete
VVVVVVLQMVTQAIVGQVVEEELVDGSRDKMVNTWVSIKMESPMIIVNLPTEAKERLENPVDRGVHI